MDVVTRGARDWLSWHQEKSVLCVSECCWERRPSSILLSVESFEVPPCPTLTYSSTSSSVTQVSTGPKDGLAPCGGPILRTPWQ